MRNIFNKSVLLFCSVVYLASCGSSEQKNNENIDSTKTATNDTMITDTIKVHGTIEFPSTDGILITADSYEIMPGEKYILLCHQAGFSRGEYKETASKFNELGYNCLAIDQRSGETCNDIINETAKRAKEKGLACNYLDAEQDILSAIDYIHKKSGHKVILLGSSYSAALALKIAKNTPSLCALQLFSPGNYFESVDLKKECKDINIPIFATSSKEEAEQVKWLLEDIKSDTREQFVPTKNGDHGSRVLWPKADGGEEYWNALIGFLNKIEKSTI